MINPPQKNQGATQARTHLDRGFRYEQGGTLERALKEDGVLEAWEPIVETLQ